jgi:hypothetical protein
MFDQSIVQSDTFLEMPLSSQMLYVHLSMTADDYGFVSPKRIIRMVGCNDDDLKILLMKRYLLGFESGIVAIKHWQINNTIRKDRSHITTYKKELESLTKNEFGAYTEKSRIPSVANNTTLDSSGFLLNDEESTTKGDENTVVDNQVTTIGKPNDNQMSTEIRLEEIRLDKNIDTKVSIVEATAPNQAEKISSKSIDELFEYWHEAVGYEMTAQKKTNRDYASKIIKDYGIEDAMRMIKGAALASEDQYAPGISNFSDLYRKWDKLKLWGKKRMTSNSGKVFKV